MQHNKRIWAVLLCALLSALLCCCGSSKEAAEIRGRWKTSINITAATGLDAEFYIDFYCEFRDDRTYSFGPDLEKCRSGLYEIYYNNLWASFEEMRKVGLSDEQIVEAYRATMGKTVEESVNESVEAVISGLNYPDESGVYRVRNGKIDTKPDGAKAWEFVPYTVEENRLTLHETEADTVFEKVEE